MPKDLTKREDEIFCPECGIPIKKGMTSCPYCRTQIKKLIVQGEMPDYDIRPPEANKNKIVAVLLAVFFSFWSWLYTYGKNKNKFWITFGILFVMYLILIIYSFSIIASSIVYSGYGDLFFGESLIGLSIFINILSFGIWVWTIVDNATKPDSFYERYPKH